MARPRKLRPTVRAYLDHLQTKGFTGSTLATYRSQLMYFVGWAETSGAPNLDNVGREVAEAYLLLLRHHGLRIPGRWSTLRSFGRWLVQTERLLQSPFEDIVLRLDGHRLPPPVMTAEEVKAILDGIPTDTPLGLRDRAMLEVLFSSGLRKSELMRLQLLDIDAERGVLFVRQGKGRKDRVVPIGDRALHWLDRYIQNGRPEHCPDPDPGNVFLSRLGRPLSAAMVHLRCRHWVEAAEVDKRGNPHAWRHASATVLLSGGAGLRHVQAFLGHEHIRTTVLYTEVSASKLREVHRQTHPFEK